MCSWISSSRADSNRTEPERDRAEIEASTGARACRVERLPCRIPGMRRRSPTRGCPAPGPWAPEGPVPGSARKAELADIRKRNKETQPQACRPPLSAYRQTTLQRMFMKKAKNYASRPADSERLRSRSLPAIECGRVRMRVRCWGQVQTQIHAIRKRTAEALEVQDPERDGGSRRVRTKAWRGGRYRGPGQSCASLQHFAHYDVTPLILQQFPSASWAPRPPPHQPRFPAPAHIAYARARR
jgi:hypothetical protein